MRLRNIVRWRTKKQRWRSTSLICRVSRPKNALCEPAWRVTDQPEAARPPCRRYLRLSCPRRIGSPSSRSYATLELHEMDWAADLWGSYFFQASGASEG